MPVNTTGFDFIYDRSHTTAKRSLKRLISLVSNIENDMALWRLLWRAIHSIVNDLWWENAILSIDQEQHFYIFNATNTHIFFRITTLLSAYAIWECTRQMRSCGTQSEIFVCFDDHIREIHHLRTLLSSVPFIQIHNDLIRIDLIGFFVICIWFAWTSAYSKSIEWWIISNQLINNWWFMMKCRRKDWISCGFSVNQGKVSRWALGKITFKLTYFPGSTCN